MALLGARKEINWEDVKKCIKAGMNKEQTAAFVDVDVKTLNRRVAEEYNLSYADFSRQYHDRGIGEIMYMQHAKMLNNKASGNTQMLIWLGKVRLGQKEPESQSTRLSSPNDPQLDIMHEVMQLKAELKKAQDLLLEKGIINDNKSETKLELPGSDTSI